MLFLLSLNTSNKQRAPFVAAFLPFALLSLRALPIIHTDGSSLGPARLTLISGML